MKYFAFLQTIIFLVPYLSAKNQLFDIQKSDMVNNPKRVMAKKKSVRYLYLKEPKSWKIYAWNSHVTTDCNLRPNHVSDQKVQ